MLSHTLHGAPHDVMTCCLNMHQTLPHIRRRLRCTSETHHVSTSVMIIAMVPIIAVLLAALCFATTGTAASQAAVAGASPYSVGLARVVVGGGLLAVSALALRARTKQAGGTSLRDRVERGALSRVSSRRLIVAGAVGVLAYQPAFFAGTSSNGVAVGTVAALGSAPIITGVLDAALRRVRPQRRWSIATALAVVGLVLVVGAGSTTLGIGIVWSLVAGASYAFYAVAGKELMERGWSSEQTMGAMFGTAAAAALPLLALSGPTWLVSGRGAAIALWLGVVTTTIAYLLFGWGLARLAAPTVATLTLAEPFCAAILGIVVLGETVGVTAGVGLSVLALGLLVLATPVRESRRVSTHPLRG